MLGVEQLSGTQANDNGRPAVRSCATAERRSDASTDRSDTKLPSRRRSLVAPRVVFDDIDRNEPRERGRRDVEFIVVVIELRNCLRAVMDGMKHGGRRDAQRQIGLAAVTHTALRHRIASPFPSRDSRVMCPLPDGLYCCAAI